MLLGEIRRRANDAGINPRKKAKKADLIWGIQKAEGNNACYGENNGACQYTACCWFDDCFKLFKKKNIKPKI